MMHQHQHHIVLLDLILLKPMPRYLLLTYLVLKCILYGFWGTGCKLEGKLPVESDMIFHGRHVLSST